MTALDSVLGRNRTFSDQTIEAGESEDSEWIALHEFYSVHGVNFIFAGNGTLRRQYKVAAIPNDDYGSWVTFMSGLVAADSPKNYPLTLPASGYIKLRATETGGINSITNLFEHFIQTGRTS